jgi:hypothetical protein
VKVTKIRGCSATVSGMPLPPRRPAATSCQVSARWTAEQDRHRLARWLPQAFSSTPSGSVLVSNTVRASPVVISAAVIDPVRWTGWVQYPAAATWCGQRT